MDKVYKQDEVESKWYDFWEAEGYFKPEVNPNGKPFTIILPPPNANADLHFGHAMYVVEDILIRYHRMRGDATLWLPGADHAGFETQVVFEKHLSREGQSRFDFDRDTLYQMIWDFVENNKDNMISQLKKLGFSLDWSRFKFTLDKDIVDVVGQTFKKLYDDGLVYRQERLVNYCTKNGTSFSELEVVYAEKDDKLYFIRYPLSDGSGSLTVATTRPETMFGDTAVAVHPKDKRYALLVGKKVDLPLTDRQIPIITDESVESDYGTGALKITPAHDQADWETGQRNNLEAITVIGFDGKLMGNTGKYAGSGVLEARKAVIENLENQGLIEKIEDYKHRVGTCYKCGTVIEPLLRDQWFIKTTPLAQKAIEAVKGGKIKIYPPSYKKTYFDWLTNIRDWNISRQIVWGIRIPAWICKDCGSWVVTAGNEPGKCDKCSSMSLERDSDTFDTWFSSGQWPFATLKTTKDTDFGKHYPTSVMETGYDILFFWVARMVMLGLYTTSEIPFKTILLHGLVRDPMGAKMSKSKGNVVSPIEIVDQYGADAARMALIFGSSTGHDQSLSYPKLQAMRNFTNKLWNIGRFIVDFKPKDSKTEISSHPEDVAIIKRLKEIEKKVSKSLETYRFNDAASTLYEFVWHEFADNYLESVKDRRGEAQPTLEYVFRTSLELLHPFAPFITEEIWQKLPHVGKSIMVTSWPKITDHA